MICQDCIIEKASGKDSDESVPSTTPIFAQKFRSFIGTSAKSSLNLHAWRGVRIGDKIAMERS